MWGGPSTSSSPRSAAPPPCAGSARCSLAALAWPARCVPEGDEAFRVVTAVATAASPDDRTVRVTVRYLPAGLLPELVNTKATRTAADRALSERERQVLTLLLRGRGVEDIATMLEIAPRTVKFHQANVLLKLGADSQLNLLRVVL